jgi:hypothetical protein
VPKSARVPEVGARAKETGKTSRVETSCGVAAVRSKVAGPGAQRQICGESGARRAARRLDPFAVISRIDLVACFRGARRGLACARREMASARAWQSRSQRSFKDTD